MAAVALTMSLLYVLVVFVAQPALLRRRTGHSGWLATLGTSRWERIANVGFLLGCGLDLANPALALADVVHPSTLPVPAAATMIGTGALFVASLALASCAQWTMDEAWRTGVDPARPTRLVIDGPFRLVRNPTYTSLLGCSVTVALLVPTPLAAAAVLTCLAALEIQTRLVEEPHLRLVHGSAYLRYAARVGRFLPGVGQLPRTTP